VPADEEVFPIMENAKEDNTDGSSIVGGMTIWGRDMLMKAYRSPCLTSAPASRTY
jgi:hypothetical protein